MYFYISYRTSRTCYIYNFDVHVPILTFVYTVHIRIYSCHIFNQYNYIYIYNIHFAIKEDVLHNTVYYVTIIVGRYIYKLYNVFPTAIARLNLPLFYN